MHLLSVCSLVLSAFGFSIAQEDALPSRWRALHAATSSFHRHDELSLATAIAHFDAIAMDASLRSQWLHDLGEWHLLQSGNVPRAEEFLRASADQGHTSAQFLVGTLAATAEPPFPAESTLYYQFAARGESIDATMALAYRHFVGYHAPRNCETALRYYKTVADDIMRHKHALPNRAVPIQVYSPPPPARLSDDQTRLPRTDNQERERVEYLRQRASASVNSGLLVRTASLVLFSGLYQDATDAHRHAHRDAVGLLERAADLGSSSAKALLGHVHAYGLVGSSIDIPHAIQLYEDAFNASNASHNAKSEAANGLGRLYLEGIDGQPSDVERAMSYFQVAAKAGHADGVFNAANVMARVEPRRSIEYLKASAAVGHVGAIFSLARVREKQRFRGYEDVANTCYKIVKTYKHVAEHNPRGRLLLARASEAFLKGRHQHARRLYRIAAELGYEVAEQNAAWLYERFEFSSPNDAVHHPVYTQLVTRGRAQQSVDAVVRAGDVEFTKGNYRRAMKHYLCAVDMRPSHAQALYSVGYMYERGLGTVHDGPNLLRARWYYTQAQRFQPLLRYTLPVLVLRIDIQVLRHRWAERFSYFVATILDTITTSFGQQKATENSQIEFDIDTATPSSSDLPVQFVAAMIFDDSTSSLTVETTRPAQLDGITLATWLWIENSPRGAEDRVQIVQISKSVHIELTPYLDRVSWQLRIRGSETLQSVLTLTNGALRPRHWHHIIVTVDTTKAKVHCLYDGKLADSGNLLTAFLSGVPRPLIHIGHSSVVPSTREAIDRFHGRFFQFRIWRVAIPRENLDPRVLDGFEEALWVDLEFDVTDAEREETQNRIVEKRQDVYDSKVTANAIGLRMVRLPQMPE